jgi:hypothetical protein
MSQTIIDLQEGGDTVAPSPLAPLTVTMDRRRRPLVPGWLRLLLSNPKSRVGLMVFTAMVLLGVLAPLFVSAS